MIPINVSGIYTGSKAALTAISDTLRMELAPFNVKVVTVVTGAISTNTLAGGATFKLPPTSRYLSIEKEIVARARGEDGTPRMEPSVYAEKVVNDVLGGANWQIWRGGYASVVRFTSTLFPWSIAVSLISSLIGGVGIELMTSQDAMSLKGTGLDIMKTQE